VRRIQVDGVKPESFNKKEKKKKSQDDSASPASASKLERSPPPKRSRRQESDRRGSGPTIGANTEPVRGRGVGKSIGILKFCAHYREPGHTLASCLKVTYFDYNK
jgi:hypothetical protein